MPCSANQPGIFSSRVVRRRVVCEEHVEITLRVDFFPPATPGQFVQVLCRAAPGEHEAALRVHDSESWPPFGISTNASLAPLLRRPFSLGGLRRRSEGSEIDLLFRVIGPGTAWLAARHADDLVDIIGPLGRGFTLPPPGSMAVLVAGGIGLPPIRWLAEELNGARISCECACGSRARASLPVTLDGEPSTDGKPGLCVREFAQLGIRTVVATDDGSCGLRGSAVDGLLHLLRDVGGSEGAHVFACGPYPMLRAAAELCQDRRLPCEVAMEQMMACGMQTCQSCVVPVRDEGREQGWRYALCCGDGPVFDASTVIWQQP